MARFRTWTASSEAGELAPEYALRTDAVVRNKGLLKARNVRLLSGGGIERRWGTAYKVTHANGPCRYEAIGVGDGATVLFAFSDGQLDIYDSDWALLQTITSGCSWVEADLHTMQIAAEAKRVTVCSNAFFPVEISKNGSTWSAANKSWAAGAGSSLKQPYYRFQRAGVTITPSATSGTGITITASESYFVAGHVGTRIRYQGKEISITGYTSGTIVTGDVIDELYPTLTVPVTSSAGFFVGDIVQGQDSEVNGVVTGVPSGTSLTVLLTGGYEKFQFATTGEKLVGPNNRTELTAACSVTTPAASVDWDEQLISAVRGYPAGVGYHRGRQILVDFPEAPNLICASTPSDPDDYDVGEAGAADAVIETVGRDDTLRVRFVGSMEQLLVFTDAGSFYVPETVGAPFGPTNTEFLNIGPEAIGGTPPVRVSEGMMFCEKRSGRALVLVPTGNVRRSWDVADLSELSFHLMATPLCDAEPTDGPRKIVALPAVSHSDREIMVSKDDGKIAWMRYKRGQESAGWCLWDTAGEWVSIAGFDGKLRMCAKRTINGSTVYWGEELDPCLTIDGASASSLGTWAHLPSTNVYITKDKIPVREATLNGSGVTTTESWWGEVWAGLSFGLQVEYPSPIDGENGQWRPWQIVRAFIDVENTGPFMVNDYNVGLLNSAVSSDAVETMNNDVVEAWIEGISWDATVTIEQTMPYPFRIRATTLEVKN